MHLLKGLSVLLLVGYTTGCTEQEELVVYRDQTGVAEFGVEFATSVTPSSFRDGARTVVAMDVNILGIEPGSRLAKALNYDQITAVAQFDCEARVVRYLSQSTSVRGELVNSNGDELKDGDVEPNTAIEAVMDYSCGSSMNRLWASIKKEPKVRS